MPTRLPANDALSGVQQDMQNFMENYSDFSAAQLNAGKHVTLISELSRIVDARTLMQVIGMLSNP